MFMSDGRDKAFRVPSWPGLECHASSLTSRDADHSKANRRYSSPANLRTREPDGDLRTREPANPSEKNKP